jgi:hypothetical protein
VKFGARAKGTRPRLLVGLFNIAGTIDLITAISLATFYKANRY